MSHTTESYRFNKPGPLNNTTFDNLGIRKSEFRNPNFRKTPQKENDLQNNFAKIFKKFFIEGMNNIQSDRIKQFLIDPLTNQRLMRGYDDLCLV